MDKYRFEGSDVSMIYAIIHRAELTQSIKAKAPVISFSSFTYQGVHFFSFKEFDPTFSRIN